MIVFFLLNYWWLNNIGEDFGIPNEDINYTNIEYNGSTITINVMADGANVNHEVYKGRAIQDQFIDAFLDKPQEIPPNPLVNGIIGQKILSVAAGRKNYQNASGIAYASRVSSFNFYNSSGHIESLEYLVCLNPDKWNISVIALIDRFCYSRECKYQRVDYLPHSFADRCLYSVLDSKSQKHFVVPSGNYTSDIFFSPPSRWPLVFTIGSVSNRGFILNHGCEGAGLFLVCPGTRENNDTAPAKIPAALPDTEVSWDYNSFHESNASAGIFAGSLAIIMEANPKLTLSDHFFICAMTATKNSPRSFLWKKNAFGLYHNRRSGFGRLNLGKAVELAKKWPKPLGLIKMFRVKENKTPNKPISLTNTDSEVNVTIEVIPMKFNRTIYRNNVPIIEEDELTNQSTVVEVVISLYFADLGFGSFTCQLVSPNQDKRYELKILTEWSDLNENIAQLHLPSYQFLGERAIGNWTLCIPKIDNASRGILVHVGMDIYFVDEPPDQSLIDQADGANPNQPIEFHDNSNAQLKTKNNYDYIQYYDNINLSGKPPFRFLKDSVSMEANKSATIDIEVREDFRHCWVVSYFQSDDEDMNRLKVKPKISSDNRTMTLGMVPTVFNDALKMRFVIESLGEGCGFTANISVNYSNKLKPNTMWLTDYHDFRIPLRTTKMTVNWALNLKNILDDGYSTSVCISIISMESYQVLRRSFERNTGSAEIYLTDDKGITPSNRQFMLEISPSSPIDNSAITFKPIQQTITIETAPGNYRPYKNPFPLSRLIGISVLLGIAFIYVFVRIVFLFRKKIMNVDEL